MSLNRFHVMLICTWSAVVALAAIVAATLGYTPSLATAMLAGAAACVPPVIALMVFRGAPARSTVELIYDAEHASVTPSQKRPS